MLLSATVFSDEAQLSVTPSRISVAALGRLWDDQVERGARRTPATTQRGRPDQCRPEVRALQLLVTRNVAVQSRRHLLRRRGLSVGRSRYSTPPLTLACWQHKVRRE